MKHVLRMIAGGLVLMFSSIAVQAAVQPSKLDTYDSGCVVNGSTAGCFLYGSEPTGTSFDGPTVIWCKARASEKQHCRGCAPAYWNDGTPRGYQVCAYVTYTLACDCKNALTNSCTNNGFCDYV